MESVTQLKTDPGFGQVSMQLQPGPYKIVVVGYHGLGNATTTNAKKITFTNNHISDTFWTCKDFTVGDGLTNEDLDLSRIVACVRFELTDEEIPVNLKSFKCYYTGGSSTLDGFTGFGSVESRQTEELTLDDTNAFEIYTIPHYVTDHLEITVQAFDKTGTIIAEKAFHGVEVEVNYISLYKGYFFSNADFSDNQSPEFVVTGDNEWAGQYEHSF